MRIIPIYPEALQALREYIETVRPKMIAVPTEHSLFVNVSGERMSRQGFWKIIKHYQDVYKRQPGDRETNREKCPRADAARM